MLFAQTRRGEVAAQERKFPFHTLATMAPALCLLASIGALVGLLTEAPLVSAASGLSNGGGAARGALFSNRKKHSSRDHASAARAIDSITTESATAAEREKDTPVHSGFGGKAAADSGAVWLLNASRARKSRWVSRERNAEPSTSISKMASGVAGLRGGSTAASGEEEEEEAGDASTVRSMKVLVSTTKISSYVDAVSGDVLLRGGWCLSKELVRRRCRLYSSNNNHMLVGTCSASTRVGPLCRRPVYGI